MDIREIRRINATKHGQAGTHLYAVWNSMKQRCSNPSVKEYKYYGEKGIKVCKEWEDFIPFYEWAISKGYNQNLTLDRVNFDDDYKPSNCRWITIREQQRNKSNNILLTYKGETHCAKEWSEILGLNYKTIMTRLERGWNIERILSTLGDTRRKEINKCRNY